MMRQVVATLMGIIMTLYFMYYFFPLLTTEHAQTTLIFNATDPTIAASYAMGTGFYLVLPFIPIFVALFILFAYSLKRSMYD